MGLPEPDIIDNSGHPQTEKSKHAPFPAFRSLRRFPEVKGRHSPATIIDQRIRVYRQPRLYPAAQNPEKGQEQKSAPHPF